MRSTVRGSIILGIFLGCVPGCSGDDGDDGAPADTSAGGFGQLPPGAGGSTAPGAGGSTAPGAGGSTAPGAGGSTAPGAGGSTAPGAGGFTAPGAGGAESAGGAPAAGGAPPSVAPFSFFVTSLAAIRRVSGNSNGFGGDLRRGEATGLAGADKTCTEIAEFAMPGAGAKGWRAFLSTSTENARSRIGSGPWYDRLGRPIAMNIDDLLQTRPRGADPAIVDDLPNEDGVPNQAGSAEGNADDNHDTITGSNEDGTFAGPGTSCNDWTDASAFAGRPMVGHSWPARSGNSWVRAHPAPGCTPSVALVQTGPGSGTGIGNGGGYGGFYCFALSP